MSYPCNVCGKTFVKASNRLHRKKALHGSVDRNTGQTSFVLNGSTVMQHLFTCIVAGYTQSGNTYVFSRLYHEILQNNEIRLRDV